MNLVESSLYEITSLLLLPVLALILIALLYAVVALGGFAVELIQRRRGKQPRALQALRSSGIPESTDDLELRIMHRLEGLRIVSRTAPMLGLIATMIPMGPALLALGSGDTNAVGQNLVKAFSSVILALVAASISFVILTVRRRWLLQELRDIERAHAHPSAKSTEA